jgi:hypothetical protein
VFTVVGLDPSMRVPAGVELDDAGRIARAVVLTTSATDVRKFEKDARLRVLPSPEVHVGEDLASWHRIQRAAEALVDFAFGGPADVDGIEDHAPAGKGSQSKSAPKLGHLQGIIRYELNRGGTGRIVRTDQTGGQLVVYRERCTPFLTLEPSVVKAYATGKGNAEKPLLVAAAKRAGFFQLEGMTAATAEGLADAYWIARLAQTWLLIKRGRLSVDRLAPLVRRLFVARKPGEPSLLDRRLMTRA